MAVPVMSESHFSRQILIKFAGQLTLGQNGIPLFFFCLNHLDIQLIQVFFNFFNF